MKSISAICVLQGENFNPSEFVRLTTLNVKEIQRKGDIGLKGRYKGQEIPFGSLTIECLESEDCLDIITTQLSMNKILLDKSGVSDIFLTLNLEYIDQCNWEFDNKLLSKIVDLNIQLSISCWKGSDFQ